MIVNNNTTGEAVVLSNYSGHEMRISRDAEVEAHIIKVLTDYSYQRKIESIIREAVANSVDSNIEAGKKDAAVYVRLRKGPSGQWYFETEDQGLGLDVAGFDRYIMGVGESTKRNNPETFGYYGGGAKAPLCKVNSFDWICRKDGIERKFNVFKTSTVPDRSIVYEKTTNQPNGCIVHIDIPRTDDINLWKAAMKEQLAYLPNVVFTVDGTYAGTEDWNGYTIFQAPDFEMRQLTLSKPMHISLGGIYYPIDWGTLGIDQINVPVALRFSLTDGLQPTFSREALQYNQQTKDIILEKIRKVTQWLVDKYNAGVRDFDTFMEAYPHIDTTLRQVKVGDWQLTINPLLDLTGIDVKPWSVKGIQTERLAWYKSHMDTFFCQYQVTAQTNSYNNSAWIKERRFWTIEAFITQKKRVVNMGTEFLVGNFKTFLRRHYGSDTMFVLERANSKIPLFLNRELFSKSYVSLLGLNAVPRSEWRERIQEWQLVQSQLLSLIQDGRHLKGSRMYAEWLENKREEERDRRGSYGRESVSTSMGKEKGDITYGTLRESLVKPKLTADREARPIARLHKMPFLNVYLTQAQLTPETDTQIRTLLHCKKLQRRVRFVLLNQTELKHVETLHNFKTYQEFMNSRPFARTATAILASRAMDKSPDNIHLLFEAFPKYIELRDRIHAYLHSYHECLSEDLEDDILELAQKAGAWDPNIYPELQQYQQVIKDFEFLRFMQVPEKMKEEEAKTVRSMVYVFLRERKINNVLLDKYELVPRPVEEEEEVQDAADADDLQLVA